MHQTNGPLRSTRANEPRLCRHEPQLQVTERAILMGQKVAGLKP